MRAGDGGPTAGRRPAGANREISRSAVVQREPVSSPRRPSNEDQDSVPTPHVAAACAAFVLGATALASPALAQDTGGVAPGQAMLVAAPAIVGQQQQVTGSLGTSAGGRSVEIEAQATANADWTTIATTRAADDGSFTATWRAASTGRWTVRAELAGGAGAAQVTVTPSATATVYRRATATWYSQPGNRTACGIRLRRSTIGVAHRTLPCGTLVDVTWGGRSTQRSGDRPRPVRRGRALRPHPRSGEDPRLRRRRPRPRRRASGRHDHRAEPDRSSPARRPGGRRRVVALKRSARALRQAADDKVVGVLDHVAHELVGKAAVERDRVPVALVEVVAGADRGVARPQLDGELGLALDADLERRRGRARSARTSSRRP